MDISVDFRGKFSSYYLLALNGHINNWIVIITYIFIYHVEPHMPFFSLTYSHSSDWRDNQIFRVSKLKFTLTVDVLGFLPTFF